MSKSTEEVTTPGLRVLIRRRIEAPRVQYSIMLLIVINAVILGLETVPVAMQNYGSILLAIDHFILGVFVVEILLRIYAHRLAFFRDPWSLFDFVVVAIALVPASGPLAVLRALRILRVLRLLTLVPSMRRVVGALLGSIPGLSSIALVLLLIYYVFAVIATKLFAEHFPQWFGSIGESLYSLFQIMTLESWSMGIVRPVMVEYPYAWIFFIVFILIATFTMLNLFIAIIVNAMQSFTEQENRERKVALDETRDHIEADLHHELAELRSEIAELRRLLKSNPGISGLKAR
ncbi:MAG: ion transporter [Gammaproteobacteria bacterium]|jgi:voltage-gated sodium channel|nr:ion transporter [Gammaproteobacteria bacterium]